MSESTNRSDALAAPIARSIWDQKYRLKASDGTPRDMTWHDTVERVAQAGAANERGGAKARRRWAQRYGDLIGNFAFLPAGRILAGAGTSRSVTLFNCFVMGEVADDLGGIFDSVRDAALTMQAGGGIGQDFSTLRPKGALVRSIGADASGPVSFMDVWDAMCRTIMSAGARRGAMMATLRCDHPDIEDFIAAKADPGRLRNFNLSVLVTDRFVDAVRANGAWDLVFEGTVYRTVKARALWNDLMRATYDFAEPGVIFIDRVNRANNLAYCEEIRATNPCGEQPLPPYGACLLGSVNLAALVREPFSPAAGIDSDRLEAVVSDAVRFLDSMIEVSNVPLPAQRHEVEAKRRIGLGVTGLADALIYCGRRYGSGEATALAGQWMATIQNAAYRASAALAAEKGAFPLYDAAAFLARPNVDALRAETRRDIATSGVRNGCLTSIAPTGTISLLAGNVSSGIEPVFDHVYRRRLLEPDGSSREELVEDAAYGLFRARFGAEAPLPDTFVRASDLAPSAHLAMQAALQRHVDSAISKTINCPADIAFTDFEAIYLDAYDRGLKGCTTFRPNAVTGAVLSAAPAGAPMTTGMPQSGTQAEVQRGGDCASVRPAEAAIRLVDTAPGRSGEVVYMARPLERDPVLDGFTYKLKWPASDHAIYVTINDIERDGRRRPFEIFINTRNLEHYAWTVALTRMISAVFRRGGDVTFVAEELKAVFDPQGGHWIGGRYVPSLLAAIGDVIETHMNRIGFRNPAGQPGGERPEQRRSATAIAAEPSGKTVPDDGRGEVALTRGGEATGLMPQHSSARSCPRCLSLAMTRREGCWVCIECDYSRCG